MHRRSVVVFFWFLWMINVQCSVKGDGGIRCEVSSVDGTPWICEEGEELSNASKNLDIRPTTDFTCLYPLKTW